MASSYYDKWLKYFSQRDVETTTKHNYEKIPVYNSVYSNEVVDTLGPLHPITVIYSGFYHTRYKIYYDGKYGFISGQKYVAKPKKEKGATENLGIKAIDFLDLGRYDEITWNEKLIPVKIFNDYEQLSNSILHGLDKHQLISKEILEDFKVLLKKDKVVWHADIDDDGVHELGKYVGELLFGVLALKGLLYFNTTQFAVPLKSNLGLVDSFIISDNKITPISHKYGAGSPSSLFNLLDGYKFDYDQYFSKGQVVLDDLMYFRRAGVRRSLYYYGSFMILGMPYLDPDKLFKDLKERNYTRDYKIAIKKVESLTTDQKILEHLPDTMTYFFATTLTERLRNCYRSMNIIRELYKKQQIMQVNLDKDAWYNGEIKYNLTRGDPDISLIATKSVFDDLDGKHGMLTFKVKPALQER